jgi:hypothetical protein
LIYLAEIIPRRASFYYCNKKFSYSVIDFDHSAQENEMCEREKIVGMEKRRLEGQCHKMTDFFEGLKNQISIFCICADGF